MHLHLPAVSEESDPEFTAVEPTRTLHNMILKHLRDGRHQQAMLVKYGPFIYIMVFYCTACMQLEAGVLMRQCSRSKGGWEIDAMTAGVWDGYSPVTLCPQTSHARMLSVPWDAQTDCIERKTCFTQSICMCACVCACTRACVILVQTSEKHFIKFNVLGFSTLKQHEVRLLTW